MMQKIFIYDIYNHELKFIIPNNFFFSKYISLIEMMIIKNLENISYAQ